MKKIFFVVSLILLGSILINAQSNDETILLTINDQKITKTEFERIYNKNNNRNNVIDNKSVNEYLELFINFKLKVIEAESLGMDTTQSFIKELAGYRKQLTKPYFVDSSVDEKLIVEAFERMQYDIRASHILIQIAQDAFPKDTLKVYNDLIKIRERILKGEDFAKLAKEFSKDPSAAQNGGDLGYFTVFQMVYPFESAAFNTKVGDISMPARTRFGYHIIKVTDKRKAQGQVKVAHIMVTVPKDSDDEKIKKSEEKIKEFYNKLKAGEDFAELAKQFSDDKGSAKNGGELPWFGTGKMVPEFETVAFALGKKGDYSNPIRTAFGWHILKLIDKKELGDIEKLKNEIKNKISKDARAKKSRIAVIEKLKKEYNFNYDKKALSDFYRVIDTTIFDGTWELEKAKGLNKVLITFSNVTINQQEFAEFIANNARKRKKGEIKSVVDVIFSKYADDKIIEHEESRLEEKHPDFKYLMKEYHDGILLFELTDQQVWSKAVKDTVGLQAFYDKNKNNYMWGERVDAAILKYKDDNAKTIAEKYFGQKDKKLYTIEKIIEMTNKKDTANLELVESKKYSKGDNDNIDELVFKLDNTQRNKTLLYLLKENKIIFVNEVLKPQPKSLVESRGLVTADYQTFLENKWIEELRNKYKVIVNREVLSTIKNN